MDSLTFLEQSQTTQPSPVYVLHGDEDFLRRQVTTALRRMVLGEGDTFGPTTFPGDKAAYADVIEEVSTLPFLAARRLVIVENADPFVTRYRAYLEKYVARPSTVGVLVLDVKTWLPTTKLAKLVPADATIVCKGLPGARLPAWCAHRAKSEYQKQLPGPAAQLLVELVGSDMGLLEQELAKLAVYVGEKKSIDREDVDRLVGSSRTEKVWTIFQAISGKRPAEALDILDRLFTQGEDALRILGAFSLHLRQLVRAYRLTQDGKPLAAALGEAGVQEFGRRGAEAMVRHLGRSRLEQLHGWLLEVDLGIKGDSPLPPRVLLERLVVRLAR